MRCRPSEAAGGARPRRPALAPALLLALAAAAGAARGEELHGHGGPVRALAATPDGGLLLSGSFDTSLIVWQPSTGTAEHRLQAHDGPVNAVALAADGRLALSGGEDGRLIAWDLGRGVALWERPLEAKVQAVALAPARGLAAAGTGDGAVHLLALADGAPLGRVVLEGERPTALLVPPGDAALLAGGHRGGLWAVEPGPWRALPRVAGGGFAITDLAPVGEGMLAVAAIDGTVRLRRLADLEPVGELVGHDAPVLALAFEPTGRRLASGDIKGRIVLWALAEQRAERVLEPHRGPVWDLAFGGRPPTLWSAGGDAVVRRWVEGEPPPGPPPEWPAAVEPGPLAAAAGERGARLFRACRACHTVGEDGGNRAGPTLHRLFGRPAGSVPGYAYSEALARSGIVWTEETVDRLFAVGPETLTPGSKMPLQRMPDAGDRAALIAYLRRVTAPAGPARENGR